MHTVQNLWKLHGIAGGKKRVSSNQNMEYGGHSLQNINAYS